MLFYLEKSRILKRSIKNKISTFTKVSFLVREGIKNGKLKCELRI